MKDRSRHPAFESPAFLVALVAHGAVASAQLSPVVVSPQVRIGQPTEACPGVALVSARAGRGVVVFGAARSFGPVAVVYPKQSPVPLIGPAPSPQSITEDRSSLRRARLHPDEARTALPGWASPPGAATSLSFGPLGTRRVVAVLRDQRPQNGGKYNQNRPYVVYSDDGIDWKPDPDAAGNVTPIRLGNPTTNLPQASTTKGLATDPGDTPWHVDRRNHAPSIAARALPDTDDEVYIAFCARAEPGSTNTDIYISKSVFAQSQGSIAFPGPPNPEFFQLTDALLGVPGGPDGADQFVPAIEVDSCGGVNLMFYDNRHDPDRTDSVELVDVYYARITGFGTGSPSVYQARLTPESIRVDNFTGQEFLGDYHNLAVSSDGRTIYAAYISRDSADPVNGDRTCYMHRIDINCLGPLSDFDGDGEATQADADAFIAAWAAGEASADTNLDMRLDARDISDFFATHTAETSQ